MKIFLIIVIIAFAFVKIVEFFEQKQKNKCTLTGHFI